ncbi:MAG TPA: 5'-methylthioadenosine/S-adenosylhomocysteine nucleosidase [Clostridia bacterium]|nr:5'-methylthioadenosine/S-adenosylhomocysteine nucleosidase [Clostridia bacterium]
MKIALITATENESLPLCQWLGQVVGEENCAGMHIRIFVHRNIYIYLVRCGIGEILAASATQFVIDRYKVDYIINYGFVGSLSHNVKAGDLVLIDKVVHHQYDLSKIDNVEPGQYDGRSSVFFELTQSTRDNINHFLTSPLPVVTLASGDMFITDSKHKEFLSTKYNASVCDMELAGIAITALRNSVHVASIKLVSDGADENAPQDYYNYINRKVSTVEMVLSTIMENIYA